MWRLLILLNNPLQIVSAMGLKRFDVGLEMSGSELALKEMVENMIMGGKVALLGLPVMRFLWTYQSNF